MSSQLDVQQHSEGGEYRFPMPLKLQFPKRKPMLKLALDPAITQPMKVADPLKQVQLTRRGLRNVVTTIIKDLLGDKKDLALKLAQSLKANRKLMAFGIPAAAGGAGLSFMLGRMSGAQRGEQE